MVCGLDLYSGPSIPGKSVVGFCASYNKYITKFWSKSLVQDAEADVPIKSLMEKALRRFLKLNYCMPKRVIIFRAVTPRSLERADSELAQVEAALREVGLEGKVALAIVNVSRRSSTRIFA